MSGNFSSGNKRDAINPTSARATNTTTVVTGLRSAISVCFIVALYDAGAATATGQRLRSSNE
jgi:hypothetical protein